MVEFRAYNTLRGQKVAFPCPSEEQTTVHLIPSTMGTKAEKYHKRAEAADEMARAAVSPDDRERWIDLARQWRELARQADQNKWEEGASSG